MYLISLMILFACHNNSDKNKVQVENKSVSNSEKIIDNEYTRIVSRFCDTNDMGPHKYSETNTVYFDLNSKIKLDLFVFSSGIECGGAMGSIGYIIEVFRKNKESYKILYTGYGVNLKRIQEEHQNIHSFMYQDKTGNLIKVNWNGKRFNEQTLLLSDTINYKIAKY